MVIPTPRKMQLAVVEWLDSRFPFREAVDDALTVRVPNYANAFYYCFGGMVFILIVFQLLTGVFLSFYYVPDGNGIPAPAYTSVNFITDKVYLGWLIRGMHFWGAQLLIVMVVIHMARVYWTGSYRAPRELNWMVGVAMLFLVLVFSLTGYLLPWDTKAYWATQVTIKISGSPPAIPIPGGPTIDIGGFIKTFLQGGPVVGPETLQRWFTLHVFLVPAAMLGLLFVHFRLIRQHGISEPL
jgi:menaquinol-cytochrome c reductase cytochrome b subunit